ncbi:porphobilinogen synthase [Rhodothermus profundi]|uniref:Delta-aminolevulinic acid dehydratase n=1 Tax=Rhodothermus profundi TaxID=633813 RepID=A0A1M6X898_9BACT|nr:porphobilinogen synthase [Rhodothermus profundi]SHL02181.1 porphobilinogen synthase [Rhodothermus profundi]
MGIQTVDTQRALLSLVERPRRLRRTEGIRRMVRETHLSVDHLVAPLFVVEGTGVRQEVPSMPGQYRLSIDELVCEARALHALGIPAVALFPALDESLKTPDGREALNPDGLYLRAIRAVKDAVPELLVITDVALDPYSSDGHDGIVRDGRILNDETVAILARMAVVQAQAGADIVAPSDMMDGRVGAIRRALDEAGFTEVAILSYTAKYASAFYGPFRDALDSAPRHRPGVPPDKKTYQMDPANAREALRELRLDLDEGADMVMVKPALPYLDVIFRVRQASEVPVAAYQVSGEYAMLKAAARNGWLDEKATVLEALTAIRRAGADVILTYFARQVAQWLQE